MPAWFDRFTKYWASAGLLQDPTDAQANAGWSYIGAAPPTVEQFNSVQQWADQKDNWLYGQIANTINYNGTVVSDVDLFQLQKSIAGRFKEVLTANRTYYIDAVSGVDATGTGAIGSPWKTVQQGINYIINRIDMAGFSITLQLKVAATYEAFRLNQPLNGALQVTGDRLNPKLYIVKNTLGTAISTSNSGVISLVGLAVEASGSTGAFASAGVGLFTDKSSSIIFADVAFGPCSHYHIWSSGVITVPLAATNYIIYGGAIAHGRSTNSGNLTLCAAICTIQNNPTFSYSFFEATTFGLIQLWDNWTSTGACIGKKYTVTFNSLINSANAGANIPGTIAGTADTATSGYLS